MLLVGSVAQKYRLVMKAVTAKRLKQIVGSSEHDLNIAEAALLLATEEYPDLDPEIYLLRLDQLAAGVQDRLPPDACVTDVILTLNEYLFDELGFCGNTEDYYDPRNSFINEVLDRKLGIPITLSVIYMEVGHRLGLPFQAVSFPGHFLVKYANDVDEVVLDPFAGGIPVSDDELIERLLEIYGEQALDAMPLPRLLEPANKIEILIRILRNLKNVYLKHQQLEKALSAVQRILIITPDVGEELRERGEFYQHLECHRAALEDYQRYIELEPTAQDVQEIRTRIIELQQTVSRLN